MKLFRYDDVQFAAPLDSEERPIGRGRLELVLTDYEVTKETPCGYWIGIGGYKRWVSKTSSKRFAYSTTEQAFYSFTMRKKRQIEIYSARLHRAQEALELKP